MAKIHLIISADPVPNGLDQVAQCGATIPKASAIPLTEMETPSSTVMFCKACFSGRMEILRRNIYFYAISTGQDALDLEGES